MRSRLILSLLATAFLHEQCWSLAGTVGPPHAGARNRTDRGQRPRRSSCRRARAQAVVRPCAGQRHIFGDAAGGLSRSCLDGRKRRDQWHIMRRAAAPKGSANFAESYQPPQPLTYRRRSAVLGEGSFPNRHGRACPYRMHTNRKRSIPTPCSGFWIIGGLGNGSEWRCR